MAVRSIFTTVSTDQDPGRYLIYGLCDAQELRYIGKSTQGMKRPKQHWQLKTELAYKSPKTSWVKSVLSQGVVPEIVVLETCKNPEELAEAEKFWIEYFRSIGARLTNMTAGGTGGGTKWSEETRKIHMQMRNTPEWRQRISDFKKGVVYSPEILQKRKEGLARARLEGRWTPIGTLQKGKVWTEEERAKLAAIKLKGKKIGCSNGKIYASISSATRDLGLKSPSNIYQILHGLNGKKTAKGQTFWWVT